MLLKVCLIILMSMAAFWAGCGKNLSQVFFSPGVEQRVSESAALTTPAAITPASPTNFSFAVFGDPQIQSENVNMVTRFKADVGPNNIWFFVVLGDLTEDGTADQFTKIKADLDGVGIPYYATIGNHDMFQAPSNGGWSAWKTGFGPATYTVTIANAVRFIFLDTASGDIGPSQFNWLETQLKAPTSAPITMVGSHYPIYDGNTPLVWRLSSVQERYKLSSMLDQYGVYAYLSGHIHGFKQNWVGNVLHFIVGSMHPYALDYGNHGYVLFTYNNGAMTWRHVTWSDTP